MGSLKPSVGNEVATRMSRERSKQLCEMIERQVAVELGQVPRSAPQVLEPEPVTIPGGR